MIQKKYFPQQDTPSRVKKHIMNKIHKTPKKVRLMYMFKYTVIMPILLFMVVLSIGYLNIYKPHNPLTVKSEKNKQTSLNTTQTTSDNIILQNEIKIAETALNKLSDTLDEEDISL